MEISEYKDTMIHKAYVKQYFHKNAAQKNK